MPNTRAEEKHAVNFILETLKNNPRNEVTLVATGPLTNLAPRLKFISKPNSFIVLSGLLSNQIKNIVNRYKMFGFKLKKKIIINGWGTVIMRRQF